MTSALPAYELDEWRVQVYELNGSICVHPSNGTVYRSSGLNFSFLSRRWSENKYCYTTDPKRLARLVASCQRWCDRQNVAGQREHEKAQALLDSLKHE